MNNGWVDMERWRKIKESVSYYFNVCMCCKKPSESRDPQSNANASSNERDFHVIFINGNLPSCQLVLQKHRPDTPIQKFYLPQETKNAIIEAISAIEKEYVKT
nr:PREDICTED: uncharacterized protein LOC109031458 [Bemisia tabaci]